MGRRRSMEDASVCLEGLAVAGCARPVAFYGIFDGHGGTTAAEFVSTHLVPNIISDPAFAKDPAGAMVRPTRLPPPYQKRTPAFFESGDSSPSASHRSSKRPKL